MENTRLIEYFFVATRTATSHSIVFQYPPRNHGRDEYPQSILLFMFPSRSGDAPPSMYNAFVLTTATGASLHGASLCLPTTSTETSNNPADATTATLTSICLVSKAPLYASFLQYLEQLAVLGARQHRWNAMHPDKPVHFVEQCLTNLLHEVPVPRPGSAGVLCSIAEVRARFVLRSQARHEVDILLPCTPLDWEFIEYTFQLVSPEHLVALVHHALLEHSILIVGTDNLFITAVADTLRHLLAPLHWDHVFIPVVPHGVDINTLLDAPVPFIAGAHVSQMRPSIAPSTHSTVVRFDLRENRLHASQSLLPPLPEAAAALTHKLVHAHVEKPAHHLTRLLADRRAAMQHRLQDNTSGPATTGTSTCFLAGATTLHRKMARLFRHLLVEYLEGAELGVKKFLAHKSPHDKAFFLAWTDTSAFRQVLDKVTAGGAAAPGLDLAVDDADGTSSFHGHLEPVHVPLRPLTSDMLTQFEWDDAAAMVDTVAFPTLVCDALNHPRLKMPYDVPEVAAKPADDRPNSTVVEWLDNWLHGGKLDKAPPAIFHRAKTLGSHLSPRLLLHRTKTTADAALPEHHAWMETHCTAECMRAVSDATRHLDDALAKKAAPAVEQAFVDLIRALSACRAPHNAIEHRQDMEAIWSTCLGTHSLSAIYNQVGLWRPFSWLMKTWIDEGDVATAIAWLAQVQMHKPTTGSTPPVTSPTSPTSSSSHADKGLATCMEVEMEPLVHRVYATFGVGSLGLRLHPFNEKQGCQISGFQQRHESCRLQQDDVLETIDGKSVLLLPFHDVVECLVECPRPMTVSFLRGLASVEDIFQVNATLALRPRREMHDRFGQLFARGIRLTLLSDCVSCGHRVSETDLREHFRSFCLACHAPFQPYFCVRFRDQPPSPPIPYLSWSELHACMMRGNGNGDVVLLPAWYSRDPDVYWNIVVKCICLDCPLDSFLVDMAPAAPTLPTKPLTDVQQLCRCILGLQSEMQHDDGLAACQAMARELLQGEDVTAVWTGSSFGNDMMKPKKHVGPAAVDADVRERIEAMSIRSSSSSVDA
ncbi:Aste57867_8203 [Aphanomyces stellatus]|uniref:Aste57867_8203 protein n=1 Tax=Aphanomyces stellatus TaxID=120398 RepID=A0A485KJN6_9STRA|nr:hypothetical protein As57867_008172 [Aphanomyces stellatus]VFT85090.1 Aste57867_8203 [Aphanomyces stellatus]